MNAKRQYSTGRGVLMEQRPKTAPLPLPIQVHHTTESSDGQLSSQRIISALKEIIDYTTDCGIQQSAKKVVSNKFFNDDGVRNLDVGQLWNQYKNGDDGAGIVNNIKAKLNAIARKIDTLLEVKLKHLTQDRVSILDQTKDLRLMQLQFEHKDEYDLTQQQKKKVLNQAQRLGLYHKEQNVDENFDSLKKEKDQAKDRMIEKLNEMFGHQLQGKLKKDVLITNIEDIFFAKGFNTVETARNTNFKVQLSDGSFMYCGISDNGVRAMLSCERYATKISKIYKKLQDGMRGVQVANQNKKLYEKLVDIERHIGNVTCGNSRDAQEKAISLNSLHESFRPKVVLYAEASEWGTTACLTTAYDGAEYKEVAKMEEFDKAAKQIHYQGFKQYEKLLGNELNNRTTNFTKEVLQNDLKKELFAIANKMAEAFPNQNKMAEVFSNASSSKSSFFSNHNVNKAKLDKVLTSLDHSKFTGKDENKLLDLSNALTECFTKIGVGDAPQGIENIIKDKQVVLDTLELAKNTKEVEQLQNEHKKFEENLKKEQDIVVQGRCQNHITELDKQIKKILRDNVLPGEKLTREIMELRKYQETLNGNDKENAYDTIRKGLNIPYGSLMQLRDSAIQVFQKTVNKQSPSQSTILRTPAHNGFIMSVMDLLHHGMTDAEKSKNQDAAQYNQDAAQYNQDAANRYDNIRCKAAKYKNNKKKEEALAQYAVLNIHEEHRPFTIASGKVLMDPADAVLRPMQKELDIYKGLKYQLEDEYNAKVESIEKGKFTVEGIRGWFGIEGDNSKVSEGDQHLMQFTIDSLITADYKPDNLGHTKGQWQGLVTFDTNIPTASNANGQKFIAGMTKDTKTMNGVVQGANQSPHDFYKAKVGLITELESAYKRFDAFQDVIGKEHAYKAMIQTLTERMRFLQGSNPEEYLAFVNKFSETIQAKITSNTKYITELSKVVRGDTRAARETKEAISDSLKQYGDYLKQLKSLVDIGIGEGNNWEKAVKTAENTMLVDAKKYNSCITSLVIEKVDDVKGLYVYNAIGTQGGKYYYPFTVAGSKLIAEKGGEGFGFFSKEPDPFAHVRPKTGSHAPANNNISIQNADALITQAENESKGILHDLKKCKEKNKQSEEELGLQLQNKGDILFANGDDSDANEEMPDERTDTTEKIPDNLSKAIESARLQIQQYNDINRQLQVAHANNFVINEQAINKLQQELKQYRQKLDFEKQTLDQARARQQRIEEERKERELTEQVQREKEELEAEERRKKIKREEAIWFAKEQERIKLEAEKKAAEEKRKIEDDNRRRLEEIERQLALKEEEKRRLEEKKRQEAAKLQKMRAQKEKEEREAEDKKKLLKYERELKRKNDKEIMERKREQEAALIFKQAELQQIEQKIYDHQGGVSVLKLEQGKVFQDQYQPLLHGIDGSGQRYTIKLDQNADVRYQKDKKHYEIIQAMTNALQEAIQRTKEALESIEVDIDIDDAFVKSVITFAQENGGVGMGYYDQSNQYTSPNHKLAAQQLSYQYQTIAKQSQLLTGKENPKEFVGARFKRIPEKYTNDIVTGAFLNTVMY